MEVEIKMSTYIQLTSRFCSEFKGVGHHHCRIKKVAQKLIMVCGKIKYYSILSIFILYANAPVVVRCTAGFGGWDYRKPMKTPSMPYCKLQQSVIDS